jgi:hypothetical protein
VNSHTILEAWQVGQEVPLSIAEYLAYERVGDPDTHLIAVGSASGRITAQLVSGAPPLGARLYVGGRGLFEVEQRHHWPAPNKTQRVMLTLTKVDG